MNVILYVMDSLRSDHLGCYGYNRDTTPVLDRIAAEGVVFDNCFAQCGWTAPSAAALLSGQYPTQTGVTRMRDSLHKDISWLPEELQQHGYRTVGITSMVQVSSAFGFGRGYHSYYDMFEDPDTMTACAERGEVARGADYCLPLSADLHRRALQWLNSRDEYEQYDPFFQMIWSIDTHEPYRQGNEYNIDCDPNYRGSVQPQGRPFRHVQNKEDLNHLINLYDGSLRYQDEQLGKFIDELEQRGILDDTLLIVVGDHGEMFYEHGVLGHGKFPWEEQMKVPLLIRCPQIMPQGQRVDALVQTMDLASTILDYVGLDVSSQMQGRSLRPVIEGTQQEVHQSIVLEIPSPILREDYTRVVRTPDWKLIEYHPPGFKNRFHKLYKEFFRVWLMAIRPGLAPLLYGHITRQGIAHTLKEMCSFPIRHLTGQVEKHLYCLADDPQELKNLAEIRKDKYAELSRHFSCIGTKKPHFNSNGETPMSKEHREKIESQLADLGYIEN